MTDQTRLAQLEKEHVELVVRRFDRADAWQLGRFIAERALAPVSYTHLRAHET